jgi:hypothetical protein
MWSVAATGIVVLLCGAMVGLHFLVRLVVERRLRSRYGIGWSEVRPSLESGLGTLVVDHVASARGMLGIAIWWLPEIVSDGQVAARLPEKARLVPCPKALRSHKELATLFPQMLIVENRSVVLHARRVVVTS